MGGRGGHDEDRGRPYRLCCHRLGSWGRLVGSYFGRGVLSRGSGQRDELDHIVELGLALRATRELAMESLQQGSAFVATTRAAWPGAPLDGLATNHSGAIVYSVAVSAACAERVPLQVMLMAFCHAIAANLVSAGIRLIPLGQTDGQRAMAALRPIVAKVA
jgi:urease accessory protein